MQELNRSSGNIESETIALKMKLKSDIFIIIISNTFYSITIPINIKK